MGVHDNAGRPANTSPGWYPDPTSGGTLYWDGTRWTGDARPARRSFAAKAHHDAWWALMIFGAMFFFMSFFAGGLNDGSVPTFGLWAFFFFAGLAGIVGGIYMQRGQGPTTEAVEQRLAQERRAAEKSRRTANLAGAAAAVGRLFSPPPPTPAPSAGHDAAQVAALANPETAAALQSLRNLLYTRALTDEEYAAAKAKLLGERKTPDQFEQIEQLADLHRRGVLGDVEFSAAKARVLGF